MSYIKLTDVRKKYVLGNKEFNALDGINLEIKKGSFVVVLGPSGAGKSTLLNIIGSMDSATSGVVEVEGENIAAYARKDAIRYRANKVGFVFQSYNVIPTLTVKENVEIVKDITKTTLMVEDVLKRVGLLEMKDKFPAELSGGQLQRVSIARSLMKDTSLLLCDEPTGALDSENGVEILKLLQEQKSFGKTVIIVTHNTLIAEIADRVVTLKNGQIVSDTNQENPKKIEEVKW